MFGGGRDRFLSTGCGGFRIGEGSFHGVIVDRQGYAGAEDRSEDWPFEEPVHAILSIELDWMGTLGKGGEAVGGLRSEFGKFHSS